MRTHTHTQNFLLLVLISILICTVLAGSNYYVRILSTIDRELLKPNASVALHKHSNALVDVLPPEADSSIMMLTSGKHRPPIGHLNVQMTSYV